MEFLVMLGVVFGGAALIVIYFIIRGGINDAPFRGIREKSMEGKAESLLEKDLSSGYARYTFYQCHNYNKAYSQREWKILYEIVQIATKEMDKDSKEYAKLVAPFINAIVVDESGYYARRGMENLANRLQKFMPGVNDSVSLNYFVEPYKYVKDEQRAAESVQAEQEAQAQRAAARATATEVREAEKRYRDAVYKRKSHTGTSSETYYEIEEQKAYAALLAAQTKAANRK